MFDDDICLCANAALCPHKNKCRRAEHKVGIHTYSEFYKKNEKCEYFLGKTRKEVDKNVK